MSLESRCPLLTWCFGSFPWRPSSPASCSVAHIKRQHFGSFWKTWVNRRPTFPSVRHTSVVYLHCQEAFFWLSFRNILFFCNSDLQDWEEAIWFFRQLQLELTLEVWAWLALAKTTFMLLFAHRQWWGSDVEISWHLPRKTIPVQKRVP